MLTQSLIETLLASEYFMKAKIVIVDNMSTNKSFEILKNAFGDRLAVIQSGKNGGYAYGNNVGIRYLKKNYQNVKYCAICNPDVLINETAIETMLELMRNEPDIKLLGCKEFDGEGNEARYCWKMPSAWYEIFSSEYICNKFIVKSSDYSKEKLSAGITYVDIVHGSFFIAEMDALYDVGLLSEETFLYCEEQILSYKLKEKGYQIAVINTCEYIHDHKEPEKFQGKIKNYVLHEKSKRIFLKDYLKSNKAILLLFDIFYGLGLAERKIASFFWR